MVGNLAEQLQSDTHCLALSPLSLPHHCFTITMSDERTSRILLLTEGNYEVWRIQMVAVLIAAELWDVVHPADEVTELPKGPKGVQVQQRKRELARSKITLALDASQLPFMMGMEDPREMWEAIQDMHRSSSLNHALSLCRSFFRMCKNENETVTGWIGRVRARALELSYTPCPATIVDIVLIMTEGLPPEYSSVVTQLDALSVNSLTVSAVTTLIIGAEAQLLRSQAKALSVDLSAHIARTDVVCHQCNGHGHYKCECPTPKELTKPKKTRARGALGCYNRVPLGQHNTSKPAPTAYY